MLIAQAIVLFLVAIVGLTGLVVSQLSRPDQKWWLLSKKAWTRVLLLGFLASFVVGIIVLYLGSKVAKENARVSVENEELLNSIAEPLLATRLEDIGAGNVALKRAVDRVPKKHLIWWAHTGDSGRVLKYLEKQGKNVNAAELVARNEEIAAIAIHVRELDIAESAIARILDASPNSPTGWGLRGALHIHRSEHSEAESCFKKLAALQIKRDGPLKDASAQNNLAVLYLQWEPPRLDEARAAAEKALAIYKTRTDDRGRALSHGTLGSIERTAENMELALDHHGQAKDIHVALADIEGEARDLAGIALVLATRGEGDDLKVAEENLEKALRYEEELIRPLGTATDTLNLGIIKLKKGELVAAHRLLGNALKLMTRLDYLPGVVRARLALGKVYDERNNYPQAISELKRAVFELHALGMNSRADIVEKRIGELEKAQQSAATQPTGGASKAP